MSNKNKFGEFQVDEMNINIKEEVIEDNNETKLQEETDLLPDLPEIKEENLTHTEVIPEELNITEDEYNLVLEEFDIEKREDVEWQERTGLNSDTLCGAIETVIFMSDRPVPLIKIKNLIDLELPLRVLHSAISRLQEEYEKKHHGLRLLEVAEGYQFRTKATYSKYVQDLFKVNSLVLTPSALEVLAIIAYKQPVSKTEIEKIRGVDSSHIVRGLLDKRLVKMMGRSEEMGRPSLYGTTPEFLEVFNLSDLSMLPPEHELEELSQTSIGKISDIKTICNGEKKQILNLDELEELDQLSSNIKNISSETDFTHSLKIEEKKRSTSNGEPIKSVFELLEEHVAKKIILESNLDASTSELFANILGPKVIRDLEEGPFNVPEIEEDDDWKMIDLDTGEAIECSDSDENEVETKYEDEKDACDLNICDSKGSVVEESIELPNLFSDNESNEGATLAQALEDAFNNMQVSDNADLDDNINKASESVNQSLDALDDLTDKMAKDAESMDIDLSFLNDTENPT